METRKYKNIVDINPSFLKKTSGVYTTFFFLLVCCFSKPLYGQIGARAANDASRTVAAVPGDSVISVIPDSLISLENTFETTVFYDAEDSIISDLVTETIFLYGNAIVEYGEITLAADFIQLSLGANEVLAHGMPDTTKLVGEKVKGKPVFTQGADSYNSDTIRYNFKSTKAYVNHIVTKEGEGIIQGETVKKDSIDNMYLVDAKYSTCDLAEPHFHIAARKIKLVNKKSVISGPFNLVIADVPLPIGFPFGFFPIPKKKEIGTSGFIMGNYGEEPRGKGFYFRDFGYYHAFSEYIGMKVLGQLFSKGSWGLGVQSQYTKKYRYAGNLNAQFNFTTPNDEFSERDPSKDFSVSWSHSPQNKRPDRSFSASVNLVSNGFNQNNRRADEVQEYTRNTMGSSIQFGKNFGRLIKTTSSIRADQNVSTKALNASAGLNVGVSQFNPFVSPKKQIGKWYESFRIGLKARSSFAVNNLNSPRATSYTDYNIAGVSNEPITLEEERLIQELESLLQLPNLSQAERAGYEQSLEALTSPVIKGFKNIMERGVMNTSYSVPISLPNIKIFKYINLTPSISYQGDMFTSQLNYAFLNPQAGTDTTFTKKNGQKVTVGVNPMAEALSYGYDDSGNLNVILNPNSGGVVVVDTVNRVAFGQSYSFAAGLNTRVYGTYNFNEGKRIGAIRHTISPSISVSYRPDGDGQYAYRVATRANAEGDSTYKYLPRFLNSRGSAGAESGSLSFGISNQLEAKIRSKSDTAESEYEKVMLLNNFNIGGTYDLLANRVGGLGFALSNVSFNANTSLFKDLISVSGGGTFDPYIYQADELVTSNIAGRRINTYKWNKAKEGFADVADIGDYLSNLRLSVSGRITPKTFNKNKKDRIDEDEDPALAAMESFVLANPMAYVDFNIPWSVGVSYTFNYVKQGLAEPRIIQALQVNGDFSLTPKMKFTYNTGWDFVYKQVTLTTIGMIRELHCWDMSFNWTPIAGNSRVGGSYNFSLRVRSSLLADLKVSRTRGYYDRGGF